MIDKLFGYGAAVDIRKQILYKCMESDVTKFSDIVAILPKTDTRNINSAIFWLIKKDLIRQISLTSYTCDLGSFNDIDIIRVVHCVELRHLKRQRQDAMHRLNSLNSRISDINTSLSKTP